MQIVTANKILPAVLVLLNNCNFLAIELFNIYHIPSLLLSNFSLANLILGNNDPN